MINKWYRDWKAGHRDACLTFQGKDFIPTPTPLEEPEESDHSSRYDDEEPDEEEDEDP